MARGKAYKQVRQKVDPTHKYKLAEAIQLVKEVGYAKFAWAVELHIKTHANPKYNDQLIRGTVVLPHGTGKEVKVAAFVSEEQRDEAVAAGADLVGNEEIIKQVEAGTIDFDIIVTTGEMMRELAKVAKVLGPKGLMPSPKAGTVTTTLWPTIEEIKKGRIEFKLDKTGNIHTVVGRRSFSDEQLEENMQTVMQALMENKPSGIKGKLIKKVVLAPTMGPGVQVERQESIKR